MPPKKRIRIDKKKIVAYHSDSEDETGGADVAKEGEEGAEANDAATADKAESSTTSKNFFAAALQEALSAESTPAVSASVAASARMTGDAILSGTRTTQQKQVQRQRARAALRNRQELRLEVVRRNHVAAPTFGEVEKRLGKLAASGVVQLFNALKRQQEAWKREAKKQSVGLSLVEDNKVAIKPQAFLDALAADKGKKRTASAAAPKAEPDESKWSVLRDDFLEIKSKAWDADSSGDDSE